jgi:hypothetical protein
MAARFPNKAYLTKAPSKVQSEFAAWIEKTTGHTVPEGDVALVQRLYPLYLKTPDVVKARDAAAAERAKEKAAREKRVKEQKAAALARAEEQAARLRRELGIDTDDETSVINLAVARKQAAPVEDDSETTDESTGLVLGSPDDEFVEVTPDEDETAETVEEPSGDDTDDDDDLWDDDSDEEEDF